MNSNKSIGRSIYGTNSDKMCRRTFFSKSLGGAAGLALFTCPGIRTDFLAAQGEESKEEIFKELEVKIDKFLPMYRSCAASSFAALNDQFQLKAESSIRPLMPFTGGIAMRTETCGAVSGSLLAIGFFFEPKNQTEMEKAGSSVEYAGQFFDRFEKEFGSTRCKVVQEHQYGRSYDFLNPQEQKLFMEVSQKTGKCSEVVKKAVLIAADIILENS